MCFDWYESEIIYKDTGLHQFSMFYQVELQNIFVIVTTIVAASDKAEITLQ